jgi:hypothetical protein
LPPYASIDADQASNAIQCAFTQEELCVSF